MTISTSTTGSKVGRARRQLSQLWQVPTFLIGMLAIIGVAASSPWRHPPHWHDFDASLDTLRRGLDREAPADTLVAQAENIHVELAKFPDRSPEGHFLIGSVYYRLAREKPAAEIWPRAVEHFEKVRASSLKESDRVFYQYRFGYCLYQQKRELPQALEWMMQSVDKAAEQPLEAYRMLVVANLGRTPPNLDGALTASQRVLDLTPERDAEAVALARLQYGELLLRKTARGEAAKVFAQVGSKAPGHLRVKARLLQAKALEEDGHWQKASEVWHGLTADASILDGGRARIAYAMGWCQHHMEPPNNVETIRLWTESLNLGGAYGQAAGLHLGELRLSMGESGAAQAIADWKKALANVNSSADFKNPHVEVADVCKMFDHALERFQQKQDLEKSQLIAELYGRVAPGGTAQQRFAKAAEELAEQLQDKLKLKLDPSITLEIVLAQFRRAAELHEQAAGALPDPQRLDSLWRSAQCFLAARDVSQAVRILQQHVTVEKNDPRLAESWFTLGELYRNGTEKSKAREAFVRCIEIPDTPFASRARYLLALDEIEKKALENAYVILKQNLQDDSPSFDRPAHEKSLYKIAWLVLTMRKFEEASIYLKECQRLYPDNANVLLARDQLGDCYRQLAGKERVEERELLLQLRSPELTDERRQTLDENARGRKQARIRWLTSAVRAYQELADDLARLPKKAPQEEILLRRAGIGIAECYADGDDFLEAAAAFFQVQTRNRQTVEALFAGFRVADMAELAHATQMAKKDVDAVRAQAANALRMVEEDLQALPDGHPMFKGRETHSREQWLRWLDSAQRRLLAPPKKDNSPFIR